MDIPQNWMLVYEGIITDKRPYDNDIATISDGLKGKLDKPTNGTYVLDAEISDQIKDKVTNDKYLQDVIRGGMATPERVARRRYKSNLQTQKDRSEIR